MNSKLLLLSLIDFIHKKPPNLDYFDLSLIPETERRHPREKKIKEVGCPPLEKFSCKKSQRGDQGKNLSPHPRFFKKFKRKPQRGYQRKF
jgi:hypothetical protein